MANFGSVFVVIAFIITAVHCDGQEPPLRLVQTISLNGVEKRIDHLAVDLVHQHLFVAALGNNSVEVVDLRGSRRVYGIAGLHEPQGIAYVPSSNRIFVANGQSGACAGFDGTTYKQVATIAFSGDADNVRYDEKAKQIVVGFGDGALGFFNAETCANNGTVILSGHPESFQLEKHGNRIFVNVPSAGHIAVVDRVKRRLLITWPVEAARANFPMALDEAGHRLFIGCRSPGRVLVYDTNTGKQVGTFELAGDTDDVFYDSKNRQLYASCGAGFIDVIQEKKPFQFERTAHIATAVGARTCLFVPELQRLYLAVPRRGSQQAEIRVYSVAAR